MAKIQNNLPNRYSYNFTNATQIISAFFSDCHRDAQNFGAWIKLSNVYLDSCGILVDTENSVSFP